MLTQGRIIGGERGRMTHTAAFDAVALEAPATDGSSGWLREVVVHVSMMIVVGALGVALRASFGLGIAPSVIGALAVYWGLLLVHTLVRRGQDVADLSDELEHLEDENVELRRLLGPRRPVDAGRDPHPLGALNVPPRPAPAIFAKDVAPSVAAKAPLRAPEAAERSPVKPAGKPAGKFDVRPGAKPGLKAEPVLSPAAPTRPPMKSSLPPPAAKLSAPARPGPGPSNTRTIPPPLPTPRPAQGLAALVADRPPHVAAPHVSPPAGQPGRAEAARAAAKPAAATVEVVEDPRAQDIAIMQSLIKGLADQINTPVRTEATLRPAPLPHTIAPEPAARPLDTVDGQVGALRHAASALRAPATAQEFGDLESGGDLSLHAQLAGAIEASRIDIYLDPILGLDDRKARHFEVSVRLRNDDGEVLDPREFAGAIAGTGLGPRIEAYTFSESIRLAGQFAARGAKADLFSGMSAESIRDGGFHNAVSDALAPDAGLATRLVMSIAQSEIRAFGPAHWDALAVMADAGLRYALVDVVDLDMDFEALKRNGFDFARLDAPVFLKGLPAPHGFVPAADLCRHLSGLGFTLIVSRIADERELVKVFGFGALLGQGRLFGAPRPIRLERTPAQSTAAA